MLNTLFGARKAEVIKVLTAESSMTTKLDDAFPNREDAVIFFTTCAIDGEIDAVEAFIRCGVDINGLVQDNYTAIHLASQEGHLAVVKLLLSRGADLHVETQEKGRYAFYSACLQGHFDVVQFLRPHVSNIDKKIKSGVTPLNATCGNGHLGIVKFLLESGADVNSSDNDGVTPLRVACWEGHLEIVKCLKEAGADIDKAANDDSSPLSAAAYTGRLAVVKYLTEAGAQINKRDDDGMTALYAASCNGHLNVVKYLCTEAGADMISPDNAGVLPAQAAVANGHVEVGNYLRGLARGRDGGHSERELVPAEVSLLKTEISNLKKELISMQYRSNLFLFSFAAIIAAVAFMKIFLQ